MTKSRNINARRRLWTAQEEQMVRDLYPDTTCVKLAMLLDRKPGSIYAVAARLGICKSEAFKASTRSGRIQRGQHNPAMVVTRFKTGQQPWNKGTNFQAGGRSVETRFKKGRKPEESRNYLPIGSLRVCADGYLEQKMTDDRAIVPARRWTAVHRLVWEAAHGPIPAKHVVVYKPGRKTVVLEEITLDAIECISRKALVNRNSIWGKDPELGKLYQLKGAITRQVNRITQESQPAP